MKKQIKKLLKLAAILLLTSACTHEYEETAIPAFKNSDNANRLLPYLEIAPKTYVAGYTTNTTNKKRATLWVNNVPTYLTDGVLVSEANDVFITDNNDVYVCGYEGSYGKIWKNGVNICNNLEIYSVNKVKIYNNHIYAIGVFRTNDAFQAAHIAIKDMQIYRTIHEGVSTKLFYLLPNQSGFNVGGLFQVGNNAGRSANHVIGTNSLSLEDSNCLYYTDAIKSGNYYYLAGLYMDNGIPRAKIVSNGPNLGYFEPANTSSQATSVVVNGTDLYAGGSMIENSKNRARIWKNGVGEYLPNQTILNISDYSSVVSDLVVAGTTLYTVGNAVLPNYRSVAKIWINNTENLLGDGKTDCKANAVAIAYPVLVYNK